MQPLILDERHFLLKAPAGSAEGSYHVENESSADMKRTWVGYGLPRDWMDRDQCEGHDFLHETTQVENIWVPMGE